MFLIPFHPLPWCFSNCSEVKNPICEILKQWNWGSLPASDLVSMVGTWEPGVLLAPLQKKDTDIYIPVPLTPRHSWSSVEGAKVDVRVAELRATGSGSRALPQQATSCLISVCNSEHKFHAFPCCLHRHKTPVLRHLSSCFMIAQGHEPH